MYALHFLRTKCTQLQQRGGIQELCMYIFGAFTTKSSNVIMTALLLQYITPTEYGLITLLHSFTGLVTIIMGGGLKQILLCSFFTYSAAEQKRLITTLVYVYVVYALPVLLISISSTKTIAAHLFCPKTCTASLLVLAFIYCFMFFFTELLYQVLILQHQARLVTYVQVSLNWCMVASNLFLLTYCSLGMYSIMISYVVGYSCLALWAVYTYADATSVSWSHLTMSVKQVSAYLKQGITFVPTLVCNWMVLFAPRWLLSFMIPLQDVGLYACADAGGQLYFLLITQPITHTYVPRLLESFSKDTATTISSEQQNRKCTLYGIVLALLGTSIGYQYGRPFFEFLVPQSYHQAYVYIWYSIIGHIFFTGSCCLIPLLQTQHKSTHSTLFAGLSTVITIGGIFVCVPVWGVYAAAMVTTCSHIVYYVLLYWYGHLLLKRLISHEMAQNRTHEASMQT